MADKKLVIVESPSKAHTISKFLGSSYKVVASVGHVRDLPKSKLGVDIEKDFEPEYINIRGKASLIKELKKDAAASKEVFLATDPDREGEAIAWHLASLLNIPVGVPCRVTFNEITKTTVQKSIKNPRTIDMNLTDAQQARRVLDRIVGYKISPLLWKKVKRGLSAGRVQSVAVKLICDREEEIEGFTPEEYWNIFVTLAKQKDEFIAKVIGIDGEKLELNNGKDTNNIVEELEKANYTVINVKKGEKKRNPAPPFTTSTMQQEASRKLGFALRKTMSVAQSLYEGVKIPDRGSVGLITYMRTDSTRISDEARTAAKEQIVAKYGEEFYENRFYKQSSEAQDAHEGIRPTFVDLDPEEIKDSLTPEQYKLYRLIYNRFIASQMAAAIFDTVQVDIDAKANKTYNLRASGQTIKFKGFMTLYIEDRDDDKDEDELKEIPELEVNDKLVEKNIDAKQSFTEPPARYSEASLVKTLEEKGIGRPSTYATIISTIMDRGYVQKDQKKLVPTELGKVVNKLLVENFADVVNVEFTADIENPFDKVAEGKEEWKQIIRDFYGPFSKELEKVDKELEHVELVDEVSDIVCDKCGRNMVVKFGRYGKFLACPGFPECRNIKSYSEKIDVPCPVCGSEVYLRKTKRGRNYYICSQNNEKDENACKYISWNKPVVGEVWNPEEAAEDAVAKKKTTRTKKATTKKKTTKTKKKTTKKK